MLAAIWMNLKHMLSERRQTQKVTYCMIAFEMSRVGKSIETAGYWLPEAGERKEWRVTA